MCIYMCLFARLFPSSVELRFSADLNKRCIKPRLSDFVNAYIHESICMSLHICRLMHHKYFLRFNGALRQKF